MKLNRIISLASLVVSLAVLTLLFRKPQPVYGAVDAVQARSYFPLLGSTRYPPVSIARRNCFRVSK